MKVRHPYALEDGPPTPDDYVHWGGRRRKSPVDEDGVFEVPDDAPKGRLRSWAEGYGYDLDELVVGEDRTDDDAPEVCGTEMSDGTVCERPADECPYHD